VVSCEAAGTGLGSAETMVGEEEPPFVVVASVAAEAGLATISPGPGSTGAVTVPEPILGPVFAPPMLTPSLANPPL